MNNTDSASAIVWLPTEQAALKDFWEIYDTHYDELTKATSDALADDPAFGPILKVMSPAQQEENNRRSRRLIRAAILDGDWTAYAQDLKAQGAVYAQAGLQFSAWFGVIGVFRDLMAPHLLAAYGKSPQRLVAALEAMNKFVDKAMGVIGEAYLGAKEQIIGQQQAALKDLSTPVLQVRDRMLLLPMIGLIDTHRARQLTEQLLQAIRANRAKVVVIDITGVPAVDSKVANHLVQTVDAARLMGATAIVTGLSADVAQSLVTLGVDLRMLHTVGDLQGGLEEAEHVLGSRVVAAGTPNGHVPRRIQAESTRD